MRRKRSPTRFQPSRSAFNSRVLAPARAPSTSVSPASPAISSRASTSTRMEIDGALACAWAGSCAALCAGAAGAAGAAGTAASNSGGTAGPRGSAAIRLPAGAAGMPARKACRSASSESDEGPPSGASSSRIGIDSQARRRRSSRSPRISGASRSSAACTIFEMPMKPIIRASPFSVCSSRESSSCTSGPAPSIRCSAEVRRSARSRATSLNLPRSFWRIVSALISDHPTWKRFTRAESRSARRASPAAAWDD